MDIRKIWLTDSAIWIQTADHLVPSEDDRMLKGCSSGPQPDVTLFNK